MMMAKRLEMEKDRLFVLLYLGKEPTPKPPDQDVISIIPFQLHFNRFVCILRV